MGEADRSALRLDFDRRLLLEFRGSTNTSDAGLLASRELRKEQTCCAFLTFEMHTHPDEVRLTITAPKIVRALAHGLFEPFVAPARDAKA